MMSHVGPGRYDRSQTPAQRASARVERILDGATNVFAARGYLGTRVDDIVRETGISRRTLYEHFTSIDEILDRIYERAVTASFTRIFERLMDVSDPIARLRAGVAAYYELIAENPAAGRVVFDVYRHAGPVQAARHELSTTRYAHVILDFLNAAYAAGRLRIRPDETTVYALAKGVESIAVRALQREDAGSLPAAAPVMAQLLISAFGGEN